MSEFIEFHKDLNDNYISMDSDKAQLSSKISVKKDLIIFWGEVTETIDYKMDLVKLEKPKAVVSCVLNGIRYDFVTQESYDEITAKMEEK